MGFLTALWNGVKNVAGLILPVGNRAASARMSPGVRWALHLLVIALVLVGLYFLNSILGIPNLIPGSLRLLAYVWLPILFLLMYTLAWLGWWLWVLWSAEEAASYYPEIDSAWEEAMRTLAQANIRLTDLPLFLVLGRPEGPEDTTGEDKACKAEELLFNQAAQLNLVIRQAPQGPGTPIHVYASREAVFVTCAGASLLGRQAAVLSGAVEVEQGVSSSGGDSTDKTLSPNLATAPVKQLVGIVRNIAKKGGQATEDERRLMRRLERRDRQQPSLMQDAAAVADLTGRLRHLCRLIARDRQPYCPLNGVLWLIPFAATDSEQDAQNTAEVCARDLQVLRSVLKVTCPQFALVCDLEMASGFREFVQRQSQQDRQRRVGQSFPMGTDLRGQPLADALSGSIHWLCGYVLREWVYRLFRVEGQREEAPEVVAGNARLYMLLSEMRESDERLSRILTKGIAAGAEGSLRFGGCYLAGTGAMQQAFVAGVFRKLLEAQNFVAWTEEARSEDTRQSRFAQLGYTLLGGVGILVLAVVAYSLFIARPS